MYSSIWQINSFLHIRVIDNVKKQFKNYPIWLKIFFQRKFIRWNWESPVVASINKAFYIDVLFSFILVMKWIPFPLWGTDCVGVELYAICPTDLWNYGNSLSKFFHFVFEYRQQTKLWRCFSKLLPNVQKKFASHLDANEQYHLNINYMDCW